MRPSPALMPWPHRLGPRARTGTARDAAGRDLPAVGREQLGGRRHAERVGVHGRARVRIRVGRARRHRAVGRDPEPAVVGVDPPLLVDEMLESLAEVELAQNRPDRRVVEVRLEVVELERVPVHELVALRRGEPLTAAGRCPARSRPRSGRRPQKSRSRLGRPRAQHRELGGGARVGELDEPGQMRLVRTGKAPIGDEGRGPFGREPDELPGPVDNGPDRARGVAREMSGLCAEKVVDRPCPRRRGVRKISRAGLSVREPRARCGPRPAGAG